MALSDVPDLVLRVAYAIGPFGDADPAFTSTDEAARGLATFWPYVNIAGDMNQFKTRRGRSYELDRNEAGTLSGMIYDVDSDFDPINTDSPYYGGIIPMRKIQLIATKNGITYSLFTGYLETWDQTWPNIYDPWVEFTASDATMIFSNNDFTGIYPQEFSGTRINRVLDDIGWPTSDRVIRTGRTAIQAGVYENVNSLEHMDKVRETENGNLFIDELGRVVFHDRHYSIIQQAVPKYIFGNTPGGGPDNEVPYTSIGFSQDFTLVRNDINGERVGGATGEASDADSIKKVSRRTFTRSGQLFTTDIEANSAASWILGLYKDPSYRIKTVSVRPRGSDLSPWCDLWAVALGLKIGDRITVRHRRPNKPTLLFEADAIISAIEHSYDMEDWTTTFELIPAAQTDYWVLGSPTLSRLGRTTRVAY
jgi:hypothetical protein